MGLADANVNELTLETISDKTTTLSGISLRSSFLVHELMAKFIERNVPITYKTLVTTINSVLLLALWLTIKRF